MRSSSMADHPPAVINISSSAAPSSPSKLPTSTHRLATQSAADALQGLTGGGISTISSGLKYLDNALVGGSHSTNAGLERGKVAEIWGPAGSGKTAFAFQAALEAIKDNGKVAWLNCATLLSAARLNAIKIPKDESEKLSIDDCFHYLSVATLSHLLALILHPPPSFPPDGTTLLVVDDLNSLVDLDYPRLPFNNGNRTEQQKWQAGRRYAILGSLIKALNKLATLHNLAVIVTTGCSSRMRTDEGLMAAIGPGIGGAEWENGIWSRTVVFRDFNGRFAGVQKCQGRNLMPLDPVGDVRNPIGYEISEHGLVKERHVEVNLISSSPLTSGAQQKTTGVHAAKAVRKRAYEEIADSEDEDLDEYGWADNDEEVLAAESLANKQTENGQAEGAT
ncbi:DNA repair protein rhp55 [Pseudocercospora fuligena]|uniref:DNA repair protein RAD51 homolog 3 n=1 Tax=Pseudocercospora fuligena TaxID=685502 RepID=A0A8H6RKN5_9PEZI|nr:DNA repair protein rhp55 [Pseudocercospora fuligena]